MPRYSQFGALSKYKNHLAAFLVLAILILLAQYAKPGFMVSDEFERARVGGEIIETGNFPAVSEIYGEPLPYTYPPLFDLFSATAKTLSGLDFLFLWRTLSFVVLFVLFAYSYKLSHKFLDRNFSVCAALIVVLLPWVFRRTAAVIPETLGLAIFLMLLYYLTSRNFFVLSALLPILMLTHLRSFITFVLLFLAVVAWWLFFREWKPEEQRERVSLMQRIFVVFLPTLIFAIFWFLPRIGALPFASASNPWVDVSGLTGLFSWLWVFALAGAAVALYRNQKNLFSLMLIAGLVFAAAFGSTAWGFRELAYLFFPIAFLCVTLLQWLGKEINQNLSLFVFAVFAILLILPNLSWIQQESYFSQRNLASVEALNRMRGETALSDYILSYAIPLYSGKQVIIGPFMEQLADGSERAEKTHNFYSSCLAGKAALYPHSPGLVHFTPYVRNLMQCSGEEFSGWNRVYDNGTNQWYREGG